MPVCLIGLGSNLGDRQAILETAIERIAQLPRCEFITRSAWHETAPVGGPAGQANFLNAAVKVVTSLSADNLLAHLAVIENELGRLRSERWAARTIDLDLLLHGDAKIETTTLVVPHPRMAWRRFVLEPAAEIAPEMLHPTTGWTMARLLENLNTTPPYVAITGPIAVGKSRFAERLAAAVSGRLVEEQPDWTRLDSFYAAPAEHAWQTELEFLEQRARLLASLPSDQIVVSDFWFDQSVAFARAWLPQEQLGDYLTEFERLQSTIVRPRLLVVLDLPEERLLERIRTRGRPCEQRLTAAQLGRIRSEIAAQTRQAAVGPVLRIDNANHEAAFAEALAAVQAML
jgi:2-amino-4-hydroxy-6-hydroxymethyldihydropteridine diphosphokinase